MMLGLLSGDMLLRAYRRSMLESMTFLAYLNYSRLLPKLYSSYAVPQLT